MKRTELQRHTSLTPGSKLESTSLPRRTRIRPQSAKRRREQKTRRQLASPYEHERCWLGLDGCTGWAEHWHELVGSGVGGSRSDPRNLCAACSVCNSGLEDRDDRYERGLKVRTADAEPGDGGLVPRVLSRLSLAYRMKEGL